MIKISDVTSALRNKEISCRELTEKYLREAEKVNRDINAYITLTPETALKAADEVDGKIARGENLSPLAGVPFVLKDNISTNGIKTTCASRMLENYAPVYDAHTWTALKNAGAVMIGKGNMDEFAMGSTCEHSYFGGAKNPRNVGRVPGGSSGGSAAAVAGGIAVFGIGSDTGGSIREPAAFCGIVGLKPTYGSVSRRGLIAFASSLDQIGPLAASSKDAALVLDAISDKDPMDMTSRGLPKIADSLGGEIKGMKIGLAPEYFDNIPDSIKKPVLAAADKYKEMGAELIEVSFPMLKYSLPTYYILACAEASSNLGRYDGIRYGHCAEEFTTLDEMICKTRTEGFGEEVRRRILLGTYVLSSGYFDAYYKSAERIRRKIAADFAEVFNKCDALLTPTVPMTAIKFGAGLSPIETYMTDICTVPVNIAGLPAVSTPCGFDEDGLPVGLQLIGRKFDEKTVLTLSDAFERATEDKYIADTGMGVEKL